MNSKYTTAYDHASNNVTLEWMRRCMGNGKCSPQPNINNKLDGEYIIYTSLENERSFE